MRSHIAASLVVSIVGVAQFRAAADEPAKKPQPAKITAIPDPNWQPKPGDRVEVFVNDALACPCRLAYNEFLKRFDVRRSRPVKWRKGFIPGTW
jgi:hypothetical protein